MELVLVFDTGMEGIDPVVFVDVVSVLELLVLVVVCFVGLVLRLALRI